MWKCMDNPDSYVIKIKATGLCSVAGVIEPRILGSLLIL